MRLDSLRKSITELSVEEKIALIEQIRWNRNNYKPPTKAKPKSIKAVAKPRKKKETKPRTEAELIALIAELEKMVGGKDE